MITAALIGAGSRGLHAYGSYALKYPHELSFVAVAEPNREKGAKFAALHQINDTMVFDSWEEMLEKEKFCDALLIVHLIAFIINLSFKRLKKDIIFYLRNQCHLIHKKH